MVLGIVRERARQVDAGADRDTARSDHNGEDSWRTERGRVLLECQVDVVGGFPGGASHGGRLDGAQLRITDRYLLVDEGRDHGFGLPIGWLCGARALAPSDRPDAALRLRYLDGAVGRGFVLRFRGPLLHLRGLRRAEQALAALQAAGLPESAIGAASADPGLNLDWEEAARYEQENVIWNGRVTAPIGAGLERTACDIWLTTRSVIWGSGRGRGIYRAALERIRDVTAVDTSGRTATPVLIVGVDDAAGDRHDLAFLFNCQTPERNVRERGACLVGIRSRGIPLGVPPAAVQPWQPVRLALPDPPPSAPSAIEPSPRDLEVASLSVPSPLEPAGDVSSVAVEPDPVGLDADHVIADPATDTDRIGDQGAPPNTVALSLPAVDELERGTSAVPPSLPEERDDGAVVEDVPVPASIATESVPGWPAALLVTPPEGTPGVPTGRLDADEPPTPSASAGSPVAEASSPATTVVLDDALTAQPDIPADTPEPAVTPGLEHVAAYEAVALRLLTEVLQAIDARAAGHDLVPLVAGLPSEAQRVAAFAQIDSMEKCGDLSQEEADSGRARLGAVAEAGPRLRSLLELHAAGWVSDGALVKKRQAIMEPVGRLLQQSADE